MNSRGLVASAPVVSCVSAVARGVGTYCAEAAIVPKQAMMREKMYCFMMMVGWRDEARLITRKDHCGASLRRQRYRKKTGILEENRINYAFSREMIRQTP